MKIYIAAGFDSTVQVKYLEEELNKINHTIISSWPEKNQGSEKENAEQDLYEVGCAECVIFLTSTESTKGGRYIEQGFALCWKRIFGGKRLIICGAKENCFCHLEEFEYYSHVREMIHALE